MSRNAPSTARRSRRRLLLPAALALGAALAPAALATDGVPRCEITPTASLAIANGHLIISSDNATEATIYVDRGDGRERVAGQFDLTDDREDVALGLRPGDRVLVFVKRTETDGDREICTTVIEREASVPGVTPPAPPAPPKVAPPPAVTFQPTGPPTVAAPPKVAARRTAKLSISKRGPGSAYAGASITWRVTVRNVSGITARRVLLADRIPTGFSMVGLRIRVGSGDAATWRAGAVRVAGGAAKWGIGDLAAGRARTFMVTLRANRDLAGARSNVATAVANNATRVSDSARVRVVAVRPAVVVPAVTG